MITHALRIAAYVMTTFAVQMVSHFIVNAEHYAAVGHMRAEPIFALGVLAMLIQCTALSSLYARSQWARSSMLSSLQFGWLVGVFLVSYLALAEAAKYTVPAVLPWLGTEIAVGFVQFTIYGALLGLLDVQRRDSRAAAAV